jgi:molybdopterin-guanine dinucleotide biosynthesis protein B
MPTDFHTHLGIPTSVDAHRPCRAVFGLAGWSGSGKTTLAERLIRALVRDGLTVSTLKHAHHEAQIDTPGKDSWRHREAGAQEVALVTASRWALMHELRAEHEPTLAQMLERLSPCDLVLVEGFKREAIPKLEVHRQALGKPWLYPDDSLIGAVASDVSPSGKLRHFELDDIDGIAAYIRATTGV